MVKKMITNTSLITVTPSAVWVKGPFARISFITAMADDGERATKITPIIMEIARFVLEDKVDIKEMVSAKK